MKHMSHSTVRLIATVVILGVLTSCIPKQSHVDNVVSENEHSATERTGAEAEQLQFVLPPDAVSAFGGDSIALDNRFDGSAVVPMLYGNTETIGGIQYHVENPIIQWHGKNLAMDVYTGWGGLYQTLISCDTALLEPGREYIVSFASRADYSFQYYSRNFLKDTPYLSYDPAKGRAGFSTAIIDGISLAELVDGDRRSIVYNASDITDLQICDVQIALADEEAPMEYESFCGGYVVLDGVVLRSLADVRDMLLLDTDGYWKIIRYVGVTDSGTDNLSALETPRIELLTERHQYSLNAIAGRAGLQFSVYAGEKIKCPYAVYPASSTQRQLVLEAEAQLHGGFLTVMGIGLYDEIGREFFIRGINTSEAWIPSFSVHNHSQSIYRQFSQFGFNTVRICFGANLFDAQVSDGSYMILEDNLDQLERSIENARLQNIRIIVDLHIPPGGWHGSEFPPYLFSADADEVQARYIAIWTAIAERLADNKNVIGYGLCNEPQVMLSTSTEQALRQYEKVIQKAINTIREVDKNHVLIFMEPEVGFLNSKGYRENIDLSGMPAKLITLEDPQNNMMLESHKYFSGNGSYNNDTVACGVNQNNVVSSNDVWLDQWRATGGYAAGDADTWKMLEAEISFSPDAIEYCLLSPTLDFGKENSGTPVYIDRITIERLRGGTAQTVVDVSAADEDQIAAQESLLPEVRIVDSPWDPGKKCWIINDSTDNQWNGYYLMKNLVYMPGDIYTVRVHIRSGVPLSADFSIRMKTYVVSYIPKDRDEVLFYYNDEEATNKYWRELTQKADAYNYPLFLGEFNVFSAQINPRTNYELWIKDMTDAIKANRAHASVHFSFGETLGVWSDEYGRNEYLHYKRADFIKKYLLD